MRQEFNAKQLERLRFFIGDVRDRDRLRRAMEGCDYVVAAAALKRIETGHYNPSELVKTNVMGTINVIEASIDASVRKVVLLSSDKAFRPISAYGHSKALAECLVLATSHRHTIFAITRYGNVAGSAGSVVPRWRELLAQGHKALPVSDPEVTRFWMTMDEAVALVSGTLTDMRGGELVIPNLPAYRLGDLATAMGARNIMVTGLPKWEKLHECMGPGNCSDQARRMTVEELREALTHV